MFCNGLVLHRFQCLRGFGEWLDSIRDFSTHLQSLNLDASAFACLAALVLLTGEDDARAPRLPPPHRTARGSMRCFFLREYTNSSQSHQREIWCDDHRVDTMTKAAHAHTHTHPCVAACEKNPTPSSTCCTCRTPGSLISLPLLKIHSRLSCTREKWRAKALVSKVH